MLAAAKKYIFTGIFRNGTLHYVAQFPGENGYTLLFTKPIQLQISILYNTEKDYRITSTDLVLSKTTSLRLLKRGTILGVRRLFTALSEIYVEGRFSQLTHTAFSRPYLPTPLWLFLQIAGAKRKLSETRVLLFYYKGTKPTCFIFSL